MCEKCVELDNKIEYYRSITSRVTDRPTLDGIEELIERLQAQKSALHPERAEQSE
jgi:beta-phosphoglucomutase-like phosphatase (HAD superfamily)